VIKRVSVGVYNDGFIHAGNLAFLALLALFPFFIVATALATLLGQTETGSMTVATILAQLPPQVAGRFGSRSWRP
jgi:membrane protein